MPEFSPPPHLPPASHVHTPTPKPSNGNGHGPSEPLPHIFKHGDPDVRPLVDWTVRDLMPRCSTGVISGPGHVGKTAAIMDAFAALMIGPGATFATISGC